MVNLVKRVARTHSAKEKSSIITNTISGASDKLLWAKLLLQTEDLRDYGLQNGALIKLLVDCGVPARLESMVDEEYDLSDAVCELLKERPCNDCIQSTWSLQQADAFLDKVCATRSKKERTELFGKALAQWTPDDAMLMVRILKKQLRMGANSKIVVGAICASDIDLGEVNNYSRSTIGSSITVGTPLASNLASPVTSLPSVFKKSDRVIVETKYDGERIQVHMCKRSDVGVPQYNISFFSRNQIPTAEHKVSGLRTALSNTFAGVSSLILDGELVLADEDGSVLEYGTLGANVMKSYKGARPTIFLFDCMLRDGNPLVGFSLERRKGILASTVRAHDDQVHILKYEIAHDQDELKKLVDKSKYQNEEGLVVKYPNSTYSPGLRTWLKIKHEQTVDLLIVGGWYGKGKLAGRIYTFLLAAYNKAASQYITICKVSSSNNRQLEERVADLTTHIDGDVDKIPGWLHCHRNLLPMFVASKDKLLQLPIVEIKGSVTLKSNKLSVRNPRIKMVRSDKSIEDLSTTDELERLSRCAPGASRAHPHNYNK